MNEDIMFTHFLIIVSLFFFTIAVRGQIGTVAVDEWADVVDHTSFDSLWHASVVRGKLLTTGWQSPAYVRYRASIAGARPSAFLPRARTAFWVNAYLACLLETMHLRRGYRSTVWDSLWHRRDTFDVAGRRMTLDDIMQEAIRISGTVGIVACLPSGSSRGAPLPSHAATARTMHRLLRDQLRRICRSEKYLLYDPAGNILQLSTFFHPLLDGMSTEARSVPEWLLPYVTEGVAAQMALHARTMSVVVQDVIETWRKARPP
ncbi:MAG: DUF547 domain-containing protein [Ignavibacteria bacterium]|nr:DUF547 domain-containing protein [Ignavibacteria bacterium]MBK6418973.1 DUF547 domain-containing protein [Ignavibacteria bacterium]